MTAYDAIVVGGGHNGLVAAAYLGAGRPADARPRAARDGRRRGRRRPSWRPAPASRRSPTRSGGCGRRSCATSDLERHGLSLVAPGRPRLRAGAGRARGHAVGRRRRGRPRACAPGPRHDADAYPAFDRLVRALAGFLGELAGGRRPTSRSPGLGDALAGLRLGRTFRGLGRDDGRTITRVLPMAVADFVAESFETDALRAALAWRGVQYTAMGPWSAGTTAVLLVDSAGNDGGAAGQTVFARGGPGALVDALAAAARDGRRRDPHRRRGRRDHVGRRPRDRRRAGVGRGDQRAGRRRRHRPEADPDASWPTRSRSARACSGGPATSGRPGTVGQGQPRPRGLPAVHRGAATTRALDPRPDRWSRPGSTRWSGRTMRPSTAGPSDAPDPRGDDPVAGRPVAGRRRGARAPTS